MDGSDRGAPLAASAPAPPPVYSAPAPAPAPAPPSPPPLVVRGPGSAECQICGWFPAGPLTLRSTTGLLILWRWRTTHGVYCRGCGDRMYADAQARSMVRGWWGVIAPIANLINLARNRAEVGRHRKAVDAPQWRAQGVGSPAHQPLPYRSPFRPLPVAATALAAVLLSVTIWSRVHADSISSIPSTDQETASLVGTCLSTTGTHVACSDGGAAYKITNRANSVGGGDCMSGFAFRSGVTGIWHCADAYTP